MRYIASLFLILTILLPVSMQAEPNPYTTQATMQSAATGNVNGTLLNTNIGGYGFQLVTFVVTGTFSATVNPEGTQDGTNWQALFCMPISGGAGTTTFTASGGWRCNLGGSFIQVRARISGYASGSVTVTGMASFAGTVSNSSYPASAPTTTNTGYYYATWYGVKGDGVSDDGAAITTALAAVGSTCGTLYFPNATYAYATSPNFAVSCVNILADRGTIFKHTGTGNAFIVDGGATGSGILGTRYDNITVQGNSSSTNGIYVRSMLHAVFFTPRVLGSSTTGSAIRCEWCISNEWISPRVSVNEATLSPIPLYGMLFTRRTSDNAATTTQTIINPILEGLTNTGGAGLYLDYASRVVVMGGTSESNYDGLSLTINAFNNQFSLDLESNSHEDVRMFGNSNLLFGMNSTGTVHVLNGNGNRNLFYGGQYNTITVDSGAIGNIFRDIQYASAAGSFTDSGTDTVKLRVFNSTTGVFDADSALRTILTRFFPTYSANISVNAQSGSFQVIVPTDGNAFTIANPTNGATGQVMSLMIRNTTGAGLGAATFGTAYKLGAAWTQPATTFSRTITFQYDGTNWIEMSRTAADVAN